MKIKLFHYASEPVKQLNGTGYAQLKEQLKPLGIWLSVGRSWQRWCEQSDFATERLKCVHRVTVESSNILMLRSVEDIDRFTHEYGEPRPISDYRSIAWDRVAQRYSGILIAPYQFGRRYERHTSWYYSWGVASACIWDFSAILRIEQEAP